jgi:thioredoxin 1
VTEIGDVTDATFDAEILRSDLPTVVDFWGDHCPACRQISPILQELAASYAGRIRIVKMHAAENPRTANRYAVRAMPTVLAFAGGRVAGQLVGARPKRAFVELVEGLL